MKRSEGHREYLRTRTARDRRLDKDPATRMYFPGAHRGPAGSPRLMLMQLSCGHRVGIRPIDPIDDTDPWELAEKKAPDGVVCVRCKVRMRIVKWDGSLLAVLADEEAEGGVVE